MLQLYVFDLSDDYDDDRMPASALRPAEYLQVRPSWIPDFGETLLLLDPAAGVSLLPLNPFGLLYDLAAQLAEAADRLVTGKRALIRSSIEATPTYLALEPEGDVIRLSVLGSIPRPVAMTPLPPGPYSRGPDRRAELHDYVDAHRAELRPDAPGVRMIPAEQRVQDVPLAGAGMVSALRREAIDGLRLYKALVPKAAIPDVPAPE
jgi:hypothetical protein